MTTQPLKTQQLAGDTLHLHYTGNEWKLTIEPAYRHDGTAKYDGWFPRYYSRASSAKAAVTKNLGGGWVWMNTES